MYTEPSDVKSPKSSVGGPIEVIYDGGQKQFSVASFRWNGEDAIGIRWNGTETHPGMPQSRGLPTWFILPSQLEDDVLKSLLSLNVPKTDGRYEKVMMLIERKNKMVGLKDRVIDLQRRFLREHGESPNKVYIPPSDEVEISTMTREDIGNLVGEIFQRGPRALERLYGMEIEWDSGRLTVSSASGKRMDE